MADEIKFYMDEHVPKAVIRGLRQRGVDVLSVPEAGMLGASDAEQLEKARLEGRVFFTQDEDFLALHASGVEHSGIAFVAQNTSIGDMIRGLMLIHLVLEPEDMKNHLEYL